MRTEDEMGAGHSKEEQGHLKAAIREQSKVDLSYIDKIFKELSYHTDEGERLIRKPTWLNRGTFASKFGLPNFVGECLFAASDRDQNGTIDIEEFLSGMALCLQYMDVLRINADCFSRSLIWMMTKA